MTRMTRSQRIAHEGKPNVMTPTGIVHAIGSDQTNPYTGRYEVTPACGKTRARYLVPTDQPVTCKRCGS